MISEEKLKLLTELGFGRVPDCDPSYSFDTPAVAYDTNMIVRGDHADDRAYIYYACTKVNDEVLDGFFFAPSIIEHPILNYQTFNCNALVEEINNQIGSCARYVFVGGFPMFFVEVDEYDWKSKDLRFPFSDMLKIVGILDYFLSREFEIRRCSKTI